MRNNYTYLLIIPVFFLSNFLKIEEDKMVSFEVNSKEMNLKMYWKNEDGETFNSFKNLRKDLKAQKQTLSFAMNGGMYQKNYSPQGLYIENGEVLHEMNNVEEAFGNFYMQPNGIFYLNKDKTAVVQQRKNFVVKDEIEFATQSGPMLLIDGEMHPKFIEGSSNLHIRNGVGILPNGNVLFAMSKERINFYDFASYFLEKGCKNALYLDGFVSRTYLPEKNWRQLDGNFGVIIGATKKTN